MWLVDSIWQTGKLQSLQIQLSSKQTGTVLSIFALLIPRIVATIDKEMFTGTRIHIVCYGCRMCLPTLPG